MRMAWFSQSQAANRRPAGHAGCPGNLLTPVAAEGASPAAFAELCRSGTRLSTLRIQVPGSAVPSCPSTRVVPKP
jgi:hypothetical protein